MILFLIIFTAILAAAMFFGIGFYLSPQSPLVKSDAIVAISGGDTRARTLEAVRLYREKWAPLIIFSGAALDPNSPSNAESMKSIAIGNGVPASDILLDEVSVNTNQNAAGVAVIAREHQLSSLILVTSPYHQRRASVTFKRALDPGVKIINHSTTDRDWRRSKWWDTSYSQQLTLSELQKTLYVIWSGK